MLAAFALVTVLAASDRPVAEWVLRVGGSVKLEGNPAEIRDLTRLPSGDFYIEAVNLADTLMEPRELKRLSGLTHLKELYLCGRTWHSRPIPASNDSITALGELTSLETLALSLPTGTRRKFRLRILRSEISQSSRI